MALAERPFFEIICRSLIKPGVLVNQIKKRGTRPRGGKTAKILPKRLVKDEFQKDFSLYDFGN
jgi:hypothetical protein